MQKWYGCEQIDARSGVFYKNSTDVIEFKLNYLMLTFYHLK